MAKKTVSVAKGADESAMVEATKSLIRTDGDKIKGNDDAWRPLVTSQTSSYQAWSDLPSIANDASKLREKQPKEVETAAGFVKFVVKETPFPELKDESKWEYYRLNWNKKMVEYSVFLRPGGGEAIKLGYAEVRYGRVKDADFLSDVERKYFAVMVPMRAKIVEIIEFYPHVVDGYKRKGIGSALMAQIKEDCTSEGVSLMSVTPQAQEMEGLLRKFAFGNMPSNLYPPGTWSILPFYLRLRKS